MKSTRARLSSVFGLVSATLAAAASARFSSAAFAQLFLLHLVRDLFLNSR
jgi:hypothetical protein